MKTKRQLFFVLLIAFLFSGFFRSDNDIYFKINKSIDIFGRVYKELSLNYVDPIDPEKLMQAGIEGMLESLDPYTNFIDDIHQKDIDIITKGTYGGIGATVGLRNDNITIVDLIEGYSAQRQGMRIGDVIIKIDSVEVSKDNYETLSELLKGEPGTFVTVTVIREGSSEPIVFNLVREDIEVKNLSFYGFYPANSNNVYLKLSGFSRTAGEEVKKALIELGEKKEIKSIVLDLRGNPGGLLNAAIEVCEKFLKKGDLIVSVEGRDTSQTKKYYSEEEPIASRVKMAVLIDQGSASASEIVAGALQDHDRAVIIGENSFGKGLVQTVVPLSFNTSLKITTARYYTPSGRSIQKINYSDQKILLENRKEKNGTIFKTDNNRKVYSGGGIMPDSIVDNSIKSDLIQNLLAEGLFFRFATNLFNNNVNANFESLSDRYLIDKFKKYLSNINYKYESPSLRLIRELLTKAKTEDLSENLITILKNEEKNQLSRVDEQIEKYSSEIAGLIREELRARSNGRVARIIESLKHDTQFNTALSVLNNDKLYKKLLHPHAD
ncbi:S41 family peptidase [Melioribacter sp. OK-6-Me]|uniref:S41 family peptidase n=1 Tax=unclassified Melioribacter TaxID=2627329 RepID=UPI003ED90B6F